MDPILEAKGVNGQMTLYEDRVLIARKGAVAFMTQGMKGDKEIPLDRITAVQFKKHGRMVNGYLQLSVEGEIASGGGVMDATKDENTVMFSKQKKHMPEVWAQMRDEIKARAAAARKSPAAAVPVEDELDKLKKLAELKEMGVLTDEEFAAKKAQILGL